MSKTQKLRYMFVDKLWKETIKISGLLMLSFLSLWLMVSSVPLWIKRFSALMILAVIPSIIIMVLIRLSQKVILLKTQLMPPQDIIAGIIKSPLSIVGILHSGDIPELLNLNKSKQKTISKTANTAKIDNRLSYIMIRKVNKSINVLIGITLIYTLINITFFVSKFYSGFVALVSIYSIVVSVLSIRIVLMGFKLKTPTKEEYSDVIDI